MVGAVRGNYLKFTSPRLLETALKMPYSTIKKQFKNSIFSLKMPVN